VIVEGEVLELDKSLAFAVMDGVACGLIPGVEYPLMGFDQRSYYFVQRYSFPLFLSTNNTTNRFAIICF
jgi:hypothetical protein